MSEKKPSLRDQIAALLMMQSDVPPSPGVPSPGGAMYPPGLPPPPPDAVQIPPLEGAMYPPEPTDYEAFYAGKKR
jgi:hypothetical protein